MRVWDDEVPAFDMGDVAAQWFSDFLGRKLRLVRFDPEHRRLSSLEWTGGVEAPNQFSDGFPLLVASEGSLAELNRRLAAAGHGPVGIERFRPNIVLAGLEAHDEDRLGRDAHRGRRRGSAAEAGQALPALPDPEHRPGDRRNRPRSVGDTLQALSQQRIVDGAVTFGMNAIVLQGLDQTLRVGQAVTADWRFD